MNVIEALEKRHSTRSFRPEPVARDILVGIMEAALQTPSWANTQPWEIYLASGEPLERIRLAFVENLEQGVERRSDIPRPASWPPAGLERMEELRDAREKSLAAEAAANPVGTSATAGEDMTSLNRLFFRAPAVAYLCMDRSLTAWSIFDIGMLAQSIMLAATEQGVGSIPAYNLVIYPDILHRELDIPDELSILIGLALGYEEEGHPQNTFRSPRRPVDEVVKFRGI